MTQKEWEESITSQIGQVDAEIAKWTNVKEVMSGDKGVVARAEKNILKLKSKRGQMEDSLNDIKNGKAFTADGWVER